MSTIGHAAMAQQDVEKTAKHLADGGAKVNNWSQPGPAAFDFRSTSVYMCLHT